MSELSVLDFLAVGNTTANEDLSFQAAIRSLREGGRLHVPRGVFTLRQPLVLPSGARLTGDGLAESVLRFAGNGPGIIINGTADVGLEHLRFDGTNMQVGQPIIQIRGPAYRTLIADCWFENAGSWAIDAQSVASNALPGSAPVTGTGWTNIRDSYFYGSRVGAVLCVGNFLRIDGCVLDNGAIPGPSGYGIYAQDVADLMLTRSDVTRFAVAMQVIATAGSSGGNAVKISDSNLDNSHYGLLVGYNVDTSTPVIGASNRPGEMVNNVQVRGSWVGSCDWNVIVNSCDRFVISECTIVNGGGNGVTLAGRAFRGLIDGNFITGNGRGSNLYAGIYVGASASHLMIKDNTIGANLNDFGVQVVGVSIQNTLGAPVVVADNIITAAQPIIHNGESAARVYSSNLVAA